MKFSHLLLAGILIFFLTSSLATAQQSLETQPCFDEKSASPAPMITSCPTPAIPLPPGSLSATPLINGSASTHYGDPDDNIVSLYGNCGNIEKTSTCLAAQDHFARGNMLAGNIKPRCTDGTIRTGGLCPDMQPPAIVFLFIGFSNWAIEIGGGHTDIWSARGQDPELLEGQPCATRCPNLHNPDNVTPWNQVENDPIIQRSLLYQVYNAGGVVGPHVVLFNGAFGQQSLERWDPTAIGFYSVEMNNPCTFSPNHAVDPECNWKRVRGDLLLNGYSEKQVQAIFLKATDSFPQCDLKHLYCAVGENGPETEPDAYTAERYLGNILRYMKQGLPNHQPPIAARYPNLQQVFLTSRIYGGYAVNPPTPPGGTDGCVSPEPFAYQTVTKL